MRPPAQPAPGDERQEGDCHDSPHDRSRMSVHQAFALRLARRREPALQASKRWNSSVLTSTKMGIELGGWARTVPDITAERAPERADQRWRPGPWQRAKSGTLTALRRL